MEQERDHRIRFGVKGSLGWKDSIIRYRILAFFSSEFFKQFIKLGHYSSPHFRDGKTEAQRPSLARGQPGSGISLG